jgi:hypothetical protein
MKQVLPAELKGYASGVDQDTSPEQIRRYHELLRRMTPVQRLKKAMGLTLMVRKLAEAGIRQRYPTASAEEIRARLAVRLYGREQARRLCKSIPDDAV